MEKPIATLVALSAMINLSSAAHFSCRQEPSQENIVLVQHTQQQTCAIYANDFHGIRGKVPLTPPPQFDDEQPDTNANKRPEDVDEWPDDDDGDYEWPRNDSPECGYYDGLGRRISE